MESAPDPGRTDELLFAVGDVRGCMPSAAVAVDTRGVIARWSTGARALFGHRRRDAVGTPVVELLPVSGALNATGRGGDHHWLDGAGDLGGAGHVMAGWARMPGPGLTRGDVLWWAYPLSAPAPFRLLLLATDATRLQRLRGLRGTRFAPGFGPHRWFPEAAELGARLPRMLGCGRREGGGSREEGELVAARVLELGCPVLEVQRAALLPASGGLARRGDGQAPGGELPLFR